MKNRFTNTLYIDLVLKSMTDTDRANLISDLNKNLDQRTNVIYELVKLPRNKLQYKLTYTAADPSDIEYVFFAHSYNFTLTPSSLRTVCSPSSINSTSTKTRS